MAHRIAASTRAMLVGRGGGALSPRFATLTAASSSTSLLTSSSSSPRHAFSTSSSLLDPSFKPKQRDVDSKAAPTASIKLPLDLPTRAFLTLGSALASLHNPARGDMIALLSEVSGEHLLPRLREQIISTDEGRRLLIDRPEINTKTVDMEYLSGLPEGTFGKEYTRWLEWCYVGPDTRDPVRHVADPELSYIMSRYRQSHDFYHLLCLMPVSHLGETVVKVFEASHFGLPVAFLSSLAGPLRLSNEERAKLLGSDGLAYWAWSEGSRVKPLIGVRWEERWEQDFEELRRELGFGPPPPHRVFYEGRGKRKARVGGGRWPSKVLEAGAAA